MEALASSEATLSARAKTLDDLRRQYTDLTGQITEVEKELRRTLRSVGIVEDDLARDVETYREQCERIETLGELDRRVEGVRVREAGLRRDLEEYENHVALLQSAQQGLHTILEESGIHAPDVRDGVEEYHRRARLHGQWVEATEKLERATQMHAVYVGCDPETDLDARVQVLESERAAAATVHPEWADLSIDESGETYGERAREARDAAQDIERRIGDIDEEMQRLAVEHRELAAIDEDIAVSEARVNDLVQLRTDLDEAREHLEMAMRDFQKQFAPQLQLWMGEGLERLTRGRYREVTIDPVTLATSVTAPELGTTVPIDHLSSGTRDAAYLTLRVAIARFMSRSGEPLPLLLDDPFVRLDRERIAWALRYLLTLTEDTQILLFTKDDQIAAWYERLAGAPNQHIHRLSRAVAAV
ncbi:MAG: hypothetical protein JOZ89_04845 [Gammaproteobacteria bacterium]|nr:hypothetical protein [Gammaproteobacteria bacterium]